MHGGATGSGAQAGNRNALKHGRYTRELLEFKRSIRELLRESTAKLSWRRQEGILERYARIPGM